MVSIISCLMGLIRSTYLELSTERTSSTKAHRSYSQAKMESKKFENLEGSKKKPQVFPENHRHWYGKTYLSNLVW
jgi:hypothetical protein